MVQRLVTIKKFCELTGFPPAAVYTRKSKGIWPEGSVWRYESSTAKILMDLQAYDAWVENGEDRSSIALRRATMSSARSPWLTPPAPKSSSARSSSRSLLRPKLEL